MVELSSEADLSTDAALSPVILGRTSSKEDVKLGGERISLEELCAAWMGTLEKIFPNNAHPVPVSKDVPLWEKRQNKAPAIKVARPRVFIPAFPGTNCEVRHRPGL